MADSETNNRLSLFLKSGIYRFECSNAVFIDPVRVLNRSYTRFRVSPSLYYSRFFESNNAEEEESRVPINSRKRKRKEKKLHTLNEREEIAEQRHQKVRPLLLKAHEALLGTSDLLEIMTSLRDNACSEEERRESSLLSDEQSFVELGSVWQASLYEIALTFHGEDKPSQDEGSLLVGDSKHRVVPLFDNLVINETSTDVKAELLNSKYIIPKESCFYMSDLGQIYNLIPANSNCGFNLIVIDPPWENSSAHQKLKYPTLPNRYFLSLPIKQLTHSEGALVALWVTNREKLRGFVEKELFPTWGVKHVATVYWLKVKADGSLISDMDLFHHRPYECLLLGFCHGEGMDSEWWSKQREIKDEQIVISVPGDYSRKPPIGELLLEHARFSPTRCIELFAREMTAGWTSWGNEPLCFQDSKYFQERKQSNDASR